MTDSAAVFTGIVAAAGIAVSARGVGAETTGIVGESRAVRVAGLAVDAGASSEKTREDPAGDNDVCQRDDDGHAMQNPEASGVSSVGCAIDRGHE